MADIAGVTMGSAPGGGKTAFGGHPVGLRTLFFTEMWERFSYYGMRALLVLYMTAAVVDGGLGFKISDAAAIYGTYTMLVYLGSLPGGYIADRYLGQKLSVLLGGIVIAFGHFSLAFASLTTFYLGLALIILGTALLKPCISTMVGGLYGENDPRRDGGFSIYYMGINLGAMLAPLVCGFLAQSPYFLGYLKSHGIEPHLGWHFGFAAAGVGMTAGIIQFVIGRGNFAHVRAPERTRMAQGGAVEAPLTSQDWTRIGAIGILFCFATLFWAAFEQGGSSLNLFADRLTDNTIFGYAFPSSWFQSVNAVFIIVLAPLFGWLWVKLGKREPSSPAKFAWGLAWVGIGFVVIAAASAVAQKTGARVSPMWLVAVYFAHTLGELCLSPVGLSTVTKLAPIRIAALMMGVWFTSISLGSKFGGWIAGHFDPAGSLPTLFLYVAGFSLGAAVVLIFLIKPIRRLMAGVH